MSDVASKGSTVWRGRLAEFLQGRRGAIAIPIVIAAILVFLPSLGASAYWIDQLELIAIYTLVVTGLNLSFGFAGELQFGQVMMFAIGAYVAGGFTARGHTDIIMLMAIGGVGAALVGTLIAIPALRIGGWSLAMTSFFLVITIPDFATIFNGWTGGEIGLTVSIPSLFGSQLSTNGLYEVTIVVLILWMTVYRNLVTSRYGIIFRLLRESPVLASSLGFSTLRLKVLANTLGAIPAGVAGCLFAFNIAYVTPETFGLALAIGFVAASVLGGVESIYGAALGAAIFQLGPNASLSFQQYAPVVYGVFLIIAAISLPYGLGGVGKTLARMGSRRLMGTAGDGGAVEHVRLEPARTPQDPSRADSLPAAELPDLHGRQTARRLVVTDVSKAFGGVAAVRDVSLVAEPGQVTALIGSNGSGKTTLLNLISGYTKVDSGTIALGEETMTGRPAYRIARIGVARTFQTPSVPRGLTALEVVAAGRYREEPVGSIRSMLRLPSYWRARRNDRRAAMLALEEVGLSRFASDEAAKLPLGTRRLLEVARAICSRAELMLLDEPASGLSLAEVETLGNVIRSAARVGITVVLIEHNFRFIVEISDVVHVLHAGTLIASGDAIAISKDPRVIESYLGSSTVAAAATAELSDTRVPTSGGARE